MTDASVIEAAGRLTKAQREELLASELLVDGRRLVRASLIMDDGAWPVGIVRPYRSLISALTPLGLAVLTYLISQGPA